MAAEWQALNELALREPADRSTRLAVVYASWFLASLEADERPVAETPLDLLRLAADLGVGVLEPANEAILELDLAQALSLDGLAREAAQRLEDAIGRPHIPAIEEFGLRASRIELHRLAGEFDRAQAELAELDEDLEQASLEDAPLRRLEAYLKLQAALINIDIGLPDRARPLLGSARALAGLQQDRPLRETMRLVEVKLAFASGDPEWVLQVLEEDDLALERDSFYRALARARIALSVCDRELPDPSLDQIQGELLSLLDAGRLDRSARLGCLLALVDLDLAQGRTTQAEQRLSRAAGIVSSADPSADFERENAAVAQARAAIALAAGAQRAALLSALDDLETSYERFLESWASIPERAGGLGFLHFEERRVLVARLIRLTLATHSAEAGPRVALAQVLRAERLGSLAGRLQPAGSSLDEIGRTLAAPGRGLLVYLPAVQDSYVFSWDESGVRCFDLGPACRWEEAQMHLASRLRHPPAGPEDSEAIDRWARRLAEHLIPAELDALVSSWEEVSIVGLSSLGWVPFELLPLRGRNGRPLGLELALGYLPSLVVGCGLVERAEHRVALPPEDGILAVAAVMRHDPAGPPGDATLPPIPWDSAESDRFKAVWPVGRSRVVHEPHELIEALTGAGPAGTRELLVVTHGRYDSERERPAGLSVSSEQVLWCEAIEAIASPPLVVLAVCGAGRGPLRRGDDGVSNLGGAFLSAGADAVLLSPVDLSYDATVRLVELFNRELTRGASPARALLHARVSMAADASWPHPACFSLLHVMGWTHAPLGTLLPAEFPSSSGGNRSTKAWIAVWATLASGLLGTLLLSRNRRARNRRVGQPQG